MRLSALFVIILTAFFSVSVFALTSFTTQVSDIDPGGRPSDDPLIFLSSGQVVKVIKNDHETLNRLHQALKESAWLIVTLDKDRRIIEIKSTSPPIKPMEGMIGLKSLLEYNPTIISSPTEALTIFNEARIKHKESQCYNRAHVWTYEWRAKRNIYTSKFWLFFTRKYIRKYNFEWWFHVAPVLHVQDGGKVWPRIADAKYAKSLLKLKHWTDIFMRNDAPCPVVNNYSDHANYPESGWCFVMKSSMYYYQPLDLENLERYGIEKHTWNATEVKQSYNEAFDIDL
jgi:hypothetical protein